MKMISYWKIETEIHIDDGLTLFIGEYDHKNQNKEPYKALGFTGAITLNLGEF